MKECGRCKVEKSVDEFYKNNKNLTTGLSSWCKQCQKSDKKIHYKNNRDKYIQSEVNGRKWFIEYKRTLKCSRCGFNHPAALDFHHIDPSTKSFKMSNISRVEKNKTLIMEEIKKCEVLCANCHRVEHSIHY